MLHDYNSALEEYKKALEGLEQYKEALRELDRQSSRSKRQEQVPQESRIDPKQKALANKRISVLLVFNALLIIRTLSKISDRRNERQDYFNDYLDGQWDSEDEEEFNKWVFEHFPNTEICYRFFTTFKECTPFFDEMKMIVRLKDSPYPFMTYESRRQKKMFPFTEAHPAVMRPFSKFYPEGKSRQLLTLTQAFFANHPSIAKIHKTLGHQEEDPITKRECYQQALLHAKTWNKKMHSPENASDQTTIIDQRIALYKVGRMYEFLGKTYQSLGKIVRAWDCYAKALEPINGWNGHPFWQHIQMKQEELDIYIKKLKKKPSVDFFYQLASKHIKMQRYPEAVLYFAHTLTDLSKASSERETPLDYRDVKRWLTASLKRIPSSENIEISKMLDQAGHHLMKAGKYELARECFSKIDLGYKGKIGFMMSYFAEKMYFHALRECNEVLDELSESNADEEVITTFRKHIKKILVELKDKNQSTLMNLAVEEFEEIEQRSLASYHREHLYVDHAAETGGYPSDPDSSDFDASEEVQKTWKGIMEDALTHLSQFDEESDLIDFWREKLQSFSS